MTMVEKRYKHHKWEYGSPEDLQEALRAPAKYSNKMVSALAAGELGKGGLIRISFGEVMTMRSNDGQQSTSVGTTFHSSVLVTMEAAYGFAKTIMEAAKIDGLSKKFDDDTLIDDMPDVEHTTKQ